VNKEKNIHQRINAIMADVEMVMKSDKKVNGQYSFVSHDAVTRALHKPCVKHGVVVVPTIVSAEHDGNRVEMIIEVDFINMDNPSEFITTRSIGYGIDSQDKGPGKAYSYAFKMALLKTFMLESGEEDVEVSFEKYSKGSKKDIKSRGQSYRNKKSEDNKDVGGDI